MITRKFALSQVTRFRVTNYFTLLGEAEIDELIRVLSFASSEIVAVAAVNALLESSGDRPTPRAISKALRAQEAQRGPCQFCAETGLMVADGVFLACCCPVGAMPFVEDWVGKEAKA